MSGILRSTDQAFLDFEVFWMGGACRVLSLADAENWQSGRNVLVFVLSWIFFQLRIIIWTGPLALEYVAVKYLFILPEFEIVWVSSDILD